MKAAVLLGLIAGLLVAGSAIAAPAIRVTDAWARPADAGTVTAGYFTIHNQGAADRLLGVTSPLARRVAPHESVMAGAMATMRPLAQVAVPASASLAFAPGGKHLMIEGLTRKLRPGDRLPVTLTFAHAGRVRVTLRIR